MAKAGLDVVVRHVHRVAAGLHSDQFTDLELLRKFSRSRDESAFAAIVRRHGPMVMRVCRHMLRREQDAEDAFQVTFLVLSRKPGAIRKGASLAGWLHGVAYRTALTARRSAATRQRHEARAETMSKPDAAQEFEWREVQAILEEEVQALPELYRTPFVLCQMEGRGRAETARELGLREGTVSSRLHRAQQRLRERLAARGVALSAVLGILAVKDALTAVPRSILDATIRAGMAQAAGNATGEGIPASVDVLLRAVTKTLGMTRGKVATALLAATLIVVGADMTSDRLRGQHGAESAIPVKPQVAASDKLSAAGATRPGPTAPEKTSKETVTLSGRVLGPDGKLFAGAEITVRWSWPTEDAAAPRIKATSGSDGHFHLRFDRADVGHPLLPPHGDPYQFAPLQVVAAAKGYGPGWVNVDRGVRGEGLTLRLVRDDVPITGRVRDVQLRPVTDATVRVLMADRVPLDTWPGMIGGVKTDKAGRFVVTGVGRDRKVRLSIDGPTIERKQVEISTEKVSAATVEVIARPTRILEGTIRAEDNGEPLAGVVVRGGALSTEVYALTDIQGHYRLVGLPKGGGLYKLTVWPNRGQAFLPKREYAEDSQGLKPITVDFRLQRGVVLRARLVDKGTGKPVRGMIIYDPLGNNLSRPALEQNDGHGGHLWQFGFCYPDKDGYCRFAVPAGPGVVMAQGVDIPYLPRPLDPADAKTYPFIAKTPLLDGGLFHYWELFQSYRVFDVKANDKPLELDIEMDPGTTVHGRLVDPNGKPLPGVLAYGLAHSDQKVNNWSYRNDTEYRARVESQTLDTDHFVSAGLTPDGSRPVTFLHAGRKLIANVVIRANQKGLLTVRMEPWGAVTGRIVDQNGKPVVGLTIELLYPSQDGSGLLTPGTGGVAPGLLAPGRPFRTDAEGRFRVEGLIPGQKHQLTFTGGVVKDLSAQAGEVRDLKDIHATAKPAGKEEKGGADD